MRNPTRGRTGARFEAAVHRVIQTIPAGRVVTYGDVALLAGHPRAGRAVGNVMQALPTGHPTPCHRVVRANGTVGSYGAEPGSSARKIRLLRREGVHADARGRIVDFSRRVVRPQLSGDG